MADNSSIDEERVSHGKLFLPSLAMSYFAAGPLGVLVSLLLIDIGNTFNVSVGIMGQINTPYSIVAVVVALLMGSLSVRFKHKSLLLIGLLFINVSALGCFLASEYNVMLVSYSLSGLGWAMVSPMAVTLIGEHLPLEKRPNAVGWIVAGGSLAYFIGAPVVASISGIGGWRFALMVFVIPVSLVGLMLAFVGLRSTSHAQQPAIDRQTYLRGFKEVLSNRSAAACLIGDALRSAAFVAILIYGASFFIQRFSVSRSIASVVILGAAACYTLGSLFSSRLVNKLGRKPSTVSTALLAGAFTISYVYVPELWLSLTLNLAASWFFGMVTSASNSLTLEQIPKFRGTMMSIDSAAINLGSALGTIAGGLALLSFDYEGLGSALGVMGVAAALIYHLLAIDPTKT
jgi:predicted MFS family arabinose efflux permease